MSKTNLETDSKGRLAIPRPRLAAFILGCFIEASVAYFAWRSLFIVTADAEKSDLLPVILLFSLLILTFAVLAVLSRERILRFLTSLLVFLPSVFFVYSILHVVVLFLGVALGYSAIRTLYRDFDERLHIRFAPSLKEHLGPLLLGLSIALSSQYYFSIQSLSWQALIPSFDLGEGTGAFVLRVAKPFYPPLRNIEDEGTTVNAFLSASDTGMKTKLSFTPELTLLLESEGYDVEAFDKVIADSALSMKRQELSTLLGRELQGDERVTDVFSEIIRNKLFGILGRERLERFPVPALPFVLTILLFLTVYPLTLIFSRLIVPLSALVLRLLRRHRIVHIEERLVNQERLL